ncbi:MAG: hypothetical protein ABIX01_10585 [Chitinophagaceae bacterium]
MNHLYYVPLVGGFLPDEAIYTEFVTIGRITDKPIHYSQSDCFKVIRRHKRAGTLAMTAYKVRLIPDFAKARVCNTCFLRYPQPQRLKFRYFMAMKKIAGLFVLLFLHYQLSAQVFGGTPSSIKWRQVNTDAVRVIFPKGLDSTAWRMATLANSICDRYRGTVGGKLRKVNMVLQSQNTLTNAYVQLGPYRSELYLTPPQNPFQLGSLGWADNLVIHEFRHVQQYSNYRVGFSKFFSILFGENGQAVANAITVPDWFFEGDAVWNETALSNQGRGRLPAFFNAYKSLYFENKQYDWMKLRNGSFKNFVPNHYDLGYLLVAYGREKYGDSVWVNITQDAASFKGLFYPLQKAIKKHTGVDYTTFRTDALKYFQNQWLQEKTPEPQWLTKQTKNTVTDYQYAYPGKDGELIVLKSGYRQIPVFTRLLKNGTEEKIAVKDIGVDDYYSYNNGWIAYSAFKADSRWGNRDYNRIKLLNIANKEEQTIGSKTKYFSPDIFPDGKKIIVVEADPAKTCMLHLLDMSGTVLQQFTADSNLFYSHPKFSKDGSSIFVAGRQPNGDMGLLEWRLSDNQHRWILAPGNRIIAFPVVVNDTIYCSISAGGTDALYSIVLPDGSPKKLASAPTGIYQGFAADGKLVGSTFTTSGYRLASYDLINSSFGKTMTGLETLKPMYVSRTMANKENLTASATHTYPVTKYSKATGLLNFHSWQPEIDGSDYSISVLSNNVLNTLEAALTYTYNTNELSNKAGISATYGGWYLQPFIDINQTWGRVAKLNADTNVFYNETKAGGGLQLPLNFSSGKSYRYLTLQSSLNTQRVRGTGLGQKLLNDLDFNYADVRLDYSSQIQKAVQQIYPRFAHTLVADYRSIINKYTAHQVLLSGSLYLPGIMPTHSLVLTAAYQGRDTMNQYIFSNSFPFSRGYRVINFPRQWKLGANYHLPLWYPDWGFANILYLRRVRLNLFYDYTVGKSLRTGITYPFATVGTEMFVDTKVWNQLPITIGVRYSRLLNNEFRGVTQPNQWEIVLPVSLY